MYLIRNDAIEETGDIGFGLSVTIKIGFDNMNDKKPYGKISCLTDGWYHPVGNKQSIVDMLNKHEYGWRHLSKKEYFRLVSGTNQGFDK